MTKINRLRSFVNLVPRHALLTIYKTNILPVFDYGSIIYDNCSDVLCLTFDCRISEQLKYSTAKIILGCLKTISSNDVLADLNLTSLNLRRKISLLCYVSKLIFDVVPFQIIQIICSVCFTSQSKCSNTTFKKILVLSLLSP